MESEIQKNGYSVSTKIEGAGNSVILYLKDSKTGGVKGELEANLHDDAYRVLFIKTDPDVPKGKGIAGEMYVILNNFLKKKYNKVLESSPEIFMNPSSIGAWKKLTQKGLAKQQPKKPDDSYSAAYKMENRKMKPLISFYHLNEGKAGTSGNKNLALMVDVNDATPENEVKQFFSRNKGMPLFGAVSVDRDQTWKAMLVHAEEKDEALEMLNHEFGVNGKIQQSLMRGIDMLKADNNEFFFLVNVKQASESEFLDFITSRDKEDDDTDSSQ